MTVETPPPEAPARRTYGPTAPGDARRARKFDRTWIPVLAIGLPVLGLVAFALLERIAAGDRILPGVEVAGVRVAGADQPTAADRITRAARRIETEPVRVRAGTTELAIDPSTIRLRVDVGTTVRNARRAGRSGSPAAPLLGAALRRFRSDEIPLAITVDAGRLDAVLDSWGRQTARGLEDGGIRLEGTKVVETMPHAGIGLRRDAARDQLLDAWRHGRTEVIPLSYGRVRPGIDRAAVSSAARSARRLVAGSTTITVPVVGVGAGGPPASVPLVVTPEQLATAIAVTPSRGRLVVGVSPDRLHATLAPALALSGLERPSVDATWSVDGVSATVVPSQVGRALDLGAAARAIRPTRRSVVGRLREIAPARDTAWARRLNITELVSTYTTNHPCCAPRVQNIHRAADAIDGTVVEPGATFSLNDALGPRTLAKGYVEAPAIGEDLSLVQDVGGGVSQLSTTLFNATFFGGYEDVTHEVHSIYISRYPMGREATLNYPSIDNAFRNDSRSGVLIKTSYSNTSVTVSYYGNTEGRSVEREGPNVLETTEPGIEYVDDPVLPPGTEKTVQEGERGYVVENFRIIARPGRPAVRQRFVATYRMVPTKIARGPALAPPPAAPLAPPTPAPPLAR